MVLDRLVEWAYIATWTSMRNRTFWSMDLQTGKGQRRCSICPLLVLNTEEGLRTKTSCFSLKSVLRFKLTELPYHYDHTHNSNLYVITTVILVSIRISPFSSDPRLVWFNAGAGMEGHKAHLPQWWRNTEVHPGWGWSYHEGLLWRKWLPYWFRGGPWEGPPCSDTVTLWW